MSQETTPQPARRKFVTYSLRTLAAIWAAAIFYPILRYLGPHQKEVVKDVSEINLGVKTLEPGSSESFVFGTKPALLVKNLNGELKSFTAVCTHLGCNVVYQKDLATVAPGHSGEGFFCNCHLGVYDATGKNIAGPPPKPIQEFKVTVADNGEITVTKA
ncbi:MAG: Rieske (2Fe-2S) protein [Bacteroidetes bacterium]|nr:Rieske (2Fe-2S) protein [Bacteroidota bacterium]